MYLNFGYCGLKELNILNYLLKLQIKQQGKTFPQRKLSRNFVYAL